MTSYFKFAQKLDINLSQGYVFRPKHPHHSSLVNKPVSSSVMNNRLVKHMKEIGLWDGETLHGASHGVSLTLQFLGVDEESTREHVG